MDSVDMDELRARLQKDPLEDILVALQVTSVKMSWG